MVVLTLVAIVSFGVFFGSKSLPIDAASENTATITNDYILTETLPQKVVDYTETRVARWSRIEQQRAGTQYVITDNSLEVDDEGYNFTIHTEGGTTPHYVTVQVRNLGNFYATTVTIDNQVQNLAN